jgi:hypothetical protein
MIGIQQCDWHCGPPLSIFISRAGAIAAGNQDKESPVNNVVMFDASLYPAARATMA